MGVWIASRRCWIRWLRGSGSSKLFQEHDHEEFKRDHQQLMTWQVLMQEKMDRFSADRDAECRRLDALSEKTDQRIADLVLAVGKLIERRPPPLQ